MIDTSRPFFTPEAVAERSLVNLYSLILATTAYLREESLPAVKHWEFIGVLFARAWSPELGAREVAEQVALNLVAAGATLAAISGDTVQAELSIQQWPSEGAVAYFDIEQSEADAVFAIFSPITEQLGFDYRWERHGAEVKLFICR